jgi:hypothetical protein
LTHASARLPAFRNEHLGHGPESDLDGRANPEQVLRGEELDTRISMLYVAVGSALEQWKKETGTEIEPILDAESAIPPETDIGRVEAISSARQAETQIGKARDEIREADLLQRPEVDRLDRLAVDAENQIKTGRSEVSLEQPRPTLLEKAGKALDATANAMIFVGKTLKAGADIGDAWYKVWEEIEKGIFTTVTVLIRATGSAFDATGTIIRNARGLSGHQPTSPAPPPPDFDGDAVRKMILRGEAPPVAWRPFVTQLNFSFTQIADLSPLVGLTSLQVLSLDNTRITDFTPLAGLTSLQKLSLDNTGITDFTPLAGLTSLQELWLNNTRITDITPLAGLTSLQELWLEGVENADLSVLDHLAHLTIFGGPKPRGGKPK